MMEDIEGIIPAELQSILEDTQQLNLFLKSPAHLRLLSEEQLAIAHNIISNIN